MSNRLILGFVEYVSCLHILRSLTVYLKQQVSRDNIPENRTRMQMVISFSSFRNDNSFYYDIG